ncbi:MAG: NYN domain-containing protein [Candidatus Paceibacterota bacterium]|jgi:uncharacterized LabA/DUF88 family protein
MPEPAGQKEKVLVFIDAANLSAAQNKIGLSINFRAFSDVLRGDGEFIEKGLRFYEQDAIGKQGFFSALRVHGYTIIPTKESNVDDAILRDIHSMAALADRIVLVSGDEDFTDALLMAGVGKKIQVFSISTMVAARFRNKPFEYIDLADLVDQIIDKTKTNERSRRIYLDPSGQTLEIVLGDNSTITITPNQRSASVRITGSILYKRMPDCLYITVKDIN